MSQPDDFMSGYVNNRQGQAHLRSGLGYTTEPDYFEDEEVRYERSLSYSNSYSVFDDTEMSHEHRAGDVATVERTSGLFRLYLPAPAPVLSDAAATVSSTTSTRFSTPGEPGFVASLYGISKNFYDSDNDLQASEDRTSDDSDDTATADDLSMSEDDMPGQEARVDLEMSEANENAEATTEEFSVQVTSFLDLLEVVEGDCSICLGEARHGPRLFRLPCSATGSHVFHRACIGHWFENRSHCPYCRHTFEELKWEGMERWEAEEEEEENDDDEESLSNQLRQIGIPIPLQGLRGGDDAARSLMEQRNVMSRGTRDSRGADVLGFGILGAVTGDALCACIVGLLDAALIFRALDHS